MTAEQVHGLSTKGCHCSPRSFFPFLWRCSSSLSSVLNGRERLASCSSQFNLEKEFGSHWVKHCMGPRTTTDVPERREKSPALARNWTQLSFQQIPVIVTLVTELTFYNFKVLPQTFYRINGVDKQLRLVLHWDLKPRPEYEARVPNIEILHLLKKPYKGTLLYFKKYL
jgi:hypothetical protein